MVGGCGSGGRREECRADEKDGNDPADAAPSGDLSL
jgi:hypothetical protein